MKVKHSIEVSLKDWTLDEAQRKIAELRDRGVPGNAVLTKTFYGTVEVRWEENR